MNIVLLAHDEKRDLLIRFCVTHQKELAQHNLFALKSVAEQIENKADMRINQIINTFSGEYQQVSAYLSCNEVDLLIFFRSTSQVRTVNMDEINMLRICDRYETPVATNIATAELLLCAIGQRSAI